MTDMVTDLAITDLVIDVVTDVVRHDVTPRHAPSLRIGVALGGGSARGYAHIGALDSLERHGLGPQVVAGTSFGALIGALYASGKSPAALKQVAAQQRGGEILGEIADFGLHRAALFRGDKLESYFDRLTEGRSFADLEREFVVVTTDVDTGERVLLRSGSLAKALRASVALPGVFAPVVIDGRRLMDGGIGAPVPFESLDGFGLDLAVGIGVGVAYSDLPISRCLKALLETTLGQRLYTALRDSVNPHPLSALGRALAFTVASLQVTPLSREGALHLHAAPPIAWLHFHRAELAIESGAEAMACFVPTILGALGLISVGGVLQDGLA